MNKLKASQLTPNTIYYVMSELPNCCPKCCSRTEILETVLIEKEEVQVNYCIFCNSEVLMVEK